MSGERVGVLEVRACERERVRGESVGDIGGLEWRSVGGDGLEEGDSLGPLPSEHGA